MVLGSRSKAKRKYAELCGETNMFAEQAAGLRPRKPAEKALKERNECDSTEKLFLSFF